MDGHTDILIDPLTGDLACVDGDLVIGGSFDEEVQEVLFSVTGDYKETPCIGLNLIKRLKGKINISAITRDVAIAMQMDEKILESLSIEENKNLKLQVR